MRPGCRAWPSVSFAAAKTVGWWIEYGASALSGLTIPADLTSRPSHVVQNAVKRLKPRGQNGWPRWTAAKSTGTTRRANA